MSLPPSWGSRLVIHDGPGRLRRVKISCVSPGGGDGLLPGGPIPRTPLGIGPQAPRSGQLAEGYDADVIALDADPLADIGVLADPARITAVWTGGRQVKGAA